MRLWDGNLDGLVRASLSRWRVPGAIVGVLVDGLGEARSYGVADLEAGVPLTVDMRLRIASITEPFTAALALSLADGGLLDLDEPVSMQLPSEGITARKLLAHLGGLEGELGDLARFGDGDDALRRAVAETRGLGRLVDPGRWWSYGNAGYRVVGAICAERLGRTFEEALRARVLEPLGLAHTSWAEPDATGHLEQVPGTGEHEAAPSRPYPRARRPSGGLVSTAHDLLRFAAHLAGDPPFRLTPPEVPTPRGAYALGRAVQTIAGMRVWSHDGSYGGFESRLAVIPEHRSAFAILTNGAAGAAVVREVAESLLEALGVRPERPPTVDFGDAALESLTGRYAGPETETLVERCGGNLVLDTVEIDLVTGERTAQPRVEARPIGERVFAVVGGLWDGVPFDFLPESGPPQFVRLGSRLVPRA